MKTDIKARWVEALRSGEYQQGTGQLRTVTDKFCCLGVLCDLAVKAGAARWGGPTGNICFVNDGGASFFVLPQGVRQWAGTPLDVGDPEVIHKGLSVTLSELNDHAELSFIEIADIIEEQL